ncbi:carbohydrate-binding module family 13 protein [Rhizophagus irregularis DAOM 181602=DAOM 197198]|nr:carbohydrate-binding module family 13 protein [Rhizophagus irregularis DAOM 181602=DAOM 197198]
MITFKLVKVQVWKNVLKWGHAQSPELSSDPANLSKDDFNVLKGTLQHCIFFIRFYDFTSKEISDAVIPYREILPEELYVDLLQTFLSLHPNSKPIKKSRNSHKSKNVDSKIITFQHANLISKWIDKLDITDNLNTSYEFKLILRGSRDGHVVDESKAITNGASYGACFFSDLAMYGKNFYNSCCRKSSYEKHIRNTTNYFSIEEFEVFQIIK